ncbi:aldehyde dehydrogenase family protein [Varunaivibrio sulfuroxidans]|uniref:Acyl-CoA reductase-like NAD-dependent aldehyde dehydrogenase n=1 Tax=Varunaivibrio sulfuroxidans TaxID=1773489 RepID=A0A4R3JBM6_9PROT|nr:aldehyde dehydrogenase family protein [Varunaivibrio sulfuroxidans]TCS63429.1 acyl-CoA reductase-like NAD-dependent aldehyde dehydrogenase [Varunaivibrio sulfuroxidans]WES30425.1 aldehyde dehydrogenase family protein [Varunaivibrio sulfuroxidans]
MTTLKTISPVDGSVYVERDLAGPREIDHALSRAKAAQKSWRETPLATRRELLGKAVDAFLAKGGDIARELTWQMGRPVTQTPSEVAGFEERARHMLAIAPQSLGDVVPPQKEGFNRFIRRVPLGVVAVIAPWNYPYLTSVNAVIPALMAGNTVILKHSHQTPLCAERYDEAFKAAGLPEGVFQYLHLSHADTEALIADDRVDSVNFTGSVGGGAAIERAIGGRFIASGLELGGKDPGYVRPDANLAHAVENLVDGSFFNSGQSCCGIERIYVHKDVYDTFVERFVELTRTYRLGNPLEADTNLGPMVRTSSAQFVRGQIAEAVAAGAKALIDPAAFPADRPDTPYMAPQVLVDVDHTMRVMAEESFGPVVGIMKVGGDDEALALMNDSEFGLTASLWTEDEDAALALAGRVETGTVYMNRCDYLDPALAWTGVKNSGRGCTLSQIGYESLTRPMSFNFRTKI